MAKTTIATDKLTKFPTKPVWAIADKEWPLAKMANGAVVPALPPKRKNATVKTTIATEKSTTISPVLAAAIVAQVQKFAKMASGPCAMPQNPNPNVVTAKTMIVTVRPTMALLVLRVWSVSKAVAVKNAAMPNVPAV